ncbi:MAG: inositol monophosphatase family protein [Microgenomates group bacterium]
MNHTFLLAFAKKTAKRAGELVLKHYHKPALSVFKVDGAGRPNTVTKADEESESYIVSAIQSEYPDHGVYGEEGTNHELDREFVWYVDPIDGTTNFWRNIPLFGISIGLVQEKKPILGVLYFPVLDLMLSAYKGEGAQVNGLPITVSDRTLEEGLYYIRTAESRDGLQFPKVGAKTGWIRAIDASSFEFAQIAMGNAECYTFKGKQPHDMVAGVSIITEAGGKVSDEHGAPWTTDSEIIVATNGKIHEEVLNLMK